MTQPNSPDYFRAATLKTELNNVGYTQTQIAEELGINRRSVSKFVNGVMKSSNIEQWFILNTSLGYDELKIS